MTPRVHLPEWLQGQPRVSQPHLSFSWNRETEQYQQTVRNGALPATPSSNGSDLYFAVTDLVESFLQIFKRCLKPADTTRSGRDERNVQKLTNLLEG